MARRTKKKPKRLPGNDNSPTPAPEISWGKARSWFVTEDRDWCWFCEKWAYLGHWPCKKDSLSDGARFRIIVKMAATKAIAKKGEMDKIADKIIDSS